MVLGFNLYLNGSSTDHIKFQAMFLVASLVFSLATYSGSSFMIQAVTSSSYTGVAKPMEVYLHYLDRPVRTAGLETKYIMNTTRSFRFLTQKEAYANSFYKPVGLPKIVVNFYLYPNLAGEVRIEGVWQILLWVNGSAYKPATFTLMFKEITSGGVVLWDSGPINPVVVSSIGSYIDVPVQGYNLSTPLTHLFKAETTLMVSVEVNAGSSSEIRVWYDSPSYPSKAILPARDYAKPVEVKTYAYDNRETDLFYYNWSQDQRLVTVRANVTDPFGGYDVYGVYLTILDPANKSVVNSLHMVRISNGQWRNRFSSMFEASWSYQSTVQRGNYTVQVSVIDNNGYYRNLEKGSYSPFIEYRTHMFTIGIIVYYSPAFLIVDDDGIPLPNAQVRITWPNGSTDILPRFASASGYINLSHVLPADYGFIVLWKDVVVNHTIVHVESDGPYTIGTQVYQLRVTVLGNDRSSIHGAYVIVYAETEAGLGLAITDGYGQAAFRLPKGTYDIEVHYGGEYWLSAVTVTATKPAISVNASMSEEVTLADYPPPIWSTIGFWLIIAVVAVSVLVVVYRPLMRRRSIL